MGQRAAVAQAAGIHRDLHDRPCGRGEFEFVTAYQLRTAGQILADPAVVDAPERHGQAGITLSSGTHGFQVGAGEGIRNLDHAAFHQRSCLRSRDSAQVREMSRPEGAHDQHRRSRAVGQQVAQGDRGVFVASRCGPEVFLGFVEPHHRPRAQSPQFGQRFSPGRAGRMPQSPATGFAQRRQRLEQCPRLPGRGPCHQDGHRAHSAARPLHDLRQLPVVVAGHISRKRRQGGSGADGDRAMDLQDERVGNLLQRLSQSAIGARSSACTASSGRLACCGPCVGSLPWFQRVRGDAVGEQYLAQGLPLGEARAVDGVVQRGAGHLRVRGQIVVAEATAFVQTSQCCSKFGTGCDRARIDGDLPPPVSSRIVRCSVRSAQSVVAVGLPAAFGRARSPDAPNDHSRRWLPRDHPNPRHDRRTRPHRAGRHPDSRRPDRTLALQPTGRARAPRTPERTRPAHPITCGLTRHAAPPGCRRWNQPKAHEPSP